MKQLLCLAIALLLVISGMGLAENKPATTYTAEANRAWYDRLDFSDETEKENALRGLIEAPESVVITRDELKF